MPYYLPSPKAGINSKNVITASKSGIEYEIDTFSLESFVSPSRVLFQERGATILPISSGFSSQLLERQSDELPFPLSEEAIMRSEKVYYRNPSHSTDLIKGSLVIFYESGTTGRGLIGVARIINSEVMDSKTALTLYRRFGVLDEKNIDSYSNKSKLIQVLTFDNFSSFKRYIPFSKLKELGCGKANMVGPEKIDPEQLSSILHIGHEISSRDAIISIQPEYVAKIFSGKKTVELRRKAFPNSSNSRIWIYSTAPISSIVGTAIVTEIDNGTPDEIWNKYNSKCGISREQFDQYFDNTTEAFALLLSSPISFKKPISLQKLKDLSPGFTAPQYFRYIDHNDQLFDNLLDELNSKRIKLK